MGRGTPAGADAPLVVAACGRPAERRRGGRCPACGGVRREACGTPARAEAPCAAAGGGRPAEPPRGPMPRVGGGRRGPRNAREGRGPACGGRPAERPREAEAPRAAAYGGRPAERPRGPMSPACGGRHGPRNPRVGPMPRVCGGVRREACGTPARAEAPRRTTQGGRIQRPPKRLSGPLPGACRAAGPPGLRPAGAVRSRIRRHAR